MMDADELMELTHGLISCSNDYIYYITFMNILGRQSIKMDEQTFFSFSYVVTFYF